MWRPFSFWWLGLDHPPPINRPRAADPIRTVRGAGYAFDERFAAVS